MCRWDILVLLQHLLLDNLTQGTSTDLTSVVRGVHQSIAISLLANTKMRPRQNS